MPFIGQLMQPHRRGHEMFLMMKMMKMMMTMMTMMPVIDLYNRQQKQHHKRGQRRCPCRWKPSQASAFYLRCHPPSFWNNIMGGWEWGFDSQRCRSLGSQLQWLQWSMLYLTLIEVWATDKSVASPWARVATGFSLSAQAAAAQKLKKLNWPEIEWRSHMLCSKTGLIRGEHPSSVGGWMFTVWEVWP